MHPLVWKRPGKRWRSAFPRGGRITFSRRRIFGLLLNLLLVAVSVSLFVPQASQVAGVLMICGAVVGITMVSAPVKLVSGILIGVGAAAYSAALARGHAFDPMEVLSVNQTLIGMIAAVSFSATHHADGGPCAAPPFRPCCCLANHRRSAPTWLGNQHHRRRLGCRSTAPWQTLADNRCVVGLARIFHGFILVAVLGGIRSRSYLRTGSGNPNYYGVRSSLGGSSHCVHFGVCRAAPG